MATRHLTGFRQEMHRLRTSHRDGRLPLVVAGRFNPAGIMADAVRQARFCRSSGLSWAKCMQIGLRTAWKRAKAEMAQVVARQARQAPHPVQAPAARRPAPVRSYGWDRGVRAVVNGW